MSRWSIETVDLRREMPRGLCAALVGQELALVRILGLDDSIRTRALEAVEAAQVVANSYANVTLHTVGTYLARNLNNLPDYFRHAGELGRVFRAPGADPRPSVRTALCNVLELDRLSPLVERDGRGYADAVVRLHPNGAANPLHNDMIARDARGTGLCVEGAREQLSAIYCLKECGSGGELVHFRRRWQPRDERHKTLGRLGYAKAVVDGAASIRFRPAEGDLYLIDPRNYHEILPVVGSTRITMGSFLLFLGNSINEAVCIA